MSRIYLFFSLSFIPIFLFGQEEYNLQIKLNNMSPVSLHSSSNDTDHTTIYNDTSIFINTNQNNLFQLTKGENVYYLFIINDSHLEFSILEDNSFVVIGEYADFIYFINDYYKLYNSKMNTLLLSNLSSDEFEIKLYKLLNNEVFQFSQNHQKFDLLSTYSKHYFSRLLKYEYLNAISTYLIREVKDTTQAIPFHIDININLLDWERFQNDLSDDNYYQLDIFQNYVFNSLILFAVHNYQYLNTEDFQLFSTYLFDFVVDNCPEDLLFDFFQTYINNYHPFLSQQTIKYLNKLLSRTHLTKRDVSVLLASENFLIDKNEANNSQFIASNFYLEDVNGNNVSLSDFSGKFLYVDIWASWCGPCRKQFPYAKELQKKLSKRELKKIKFIYISIDTDYKKWKESIEGLNLDGYQFISPSNKINSASDYFGVSSIPRYILIDRNGSIINSNAKRPSDTTLLDDLLNLINTR